MPSPDIKRGGPFPDPFEYLEAQEIKPYPTWKSWRHEVEEACKISFRNGTSDKESNISREQRKEQKEKLSQAEALLHRLYIIRRKFQIAGGVNPVEMERFWQEAEGVDQHFAEDYDGPIRFIMRKTEPNSSGIKVRR